jgi:methyl-accepting chemotaxis protein
LAERSSGATREITDLIHLSSRHVHEGVQLNGETAKALQEILDGVTATEAKISQIASETVEQALKTQSVSKSIQDITTVVDQAAANSQEMAENSQRLGSQAEQVRSLVRRFRVEEAGMTTLCS